MKRQARALIVALMLGAMFALSGCVDIIYQVQVAEDGSGGVRVIAAYDPEQLALILEASGGETSTPLISDDLRQRAAASGLQVDEIAADPQKGLRVTGSFASPEEFPQTLDRIEQLFLSMDVAQTLTQLGAAPSLEGTLTADRGLFTTEYALSLGSGGSVEDTTLAALESIMPTKIDYAASARLPGRTVSTNGTYQPGDNSIAWSPDTAAETGEDYLAVSQVVNWTPMALIGIGAAVALVVAVVFAVRSRRKNRDAAARSDSAAVRVRSKDKRR